MVLKRQDKGYATQLNEYHGSKTDFFREFRAMEYCTLFVRVRRVFIGDFQDFSVLIRTDFQDSVRTLGSSQHNLKPMMYLVVVFLDDDTTLPLASLSDSSSSDSSVSVFRDEPRLQRKKELKYR